MTVLECLEYRMNTMRMEYRMNTIKISQECYDSVEVRKIMGGKR